MPTITLTVGLPGCGKSTWASAEVQRNKGQTVNINLDSVRATMAGSLQNYKFTKKNEKYVSEVQYQSAIAAVNDGKCIIVSDTNMSDSVVEFWRNFAKEHEYSFRTKNFFEDFKALSNKTYPHDYFYMKDFVRVCKRQNLNRYDSVPDEAIDRMADKAFYSKIVFPNGLVGVELPDAIIVDIDGTLAHMHNRSPFDETKVLEDYGDTEVILSVLAEKQYLGRKVIIMSGRHETCREDTLKWLKHFLIPCDLLLMRGALDNRGDDVVKYELYMQHVHNKYNVQKVFDDRNRVVDMWRTLLGLKVYQVAEGNF